VRNRVVEAQTLLLPPRVEASYRDSKIGEIYEGANEMQKWVLARMIFGRDITG
jgi:alkylation response protein AidB-like acyl-CoA dehydrogenase